MIHVLTVHWQSDFWVDAQLARFRRHLRDPFRVYAFCNGTHRDHRAKFDYCATESGLADHATKLNLLAEVACRNATDADVLLFCDSDAFPLRDITRFVHAALREHPLVAVQRLENAGDMQPHPCFAVTTAGLWRAIGGDWRGGHTWTNSFGRTVTDVGGNLMRQLEDAGIAWGKMHRTNVLNLHPLFFGVYADLVYHHGGGSRPSVGGRVVRFAELAGLAPEAAAAREAELLRAVDALSRRVIDVIARDDDEALFDVVARSGFRTDA